MTDTFYPNKSNMTDTFYPQVGNTNWILFAKRSSRDNCIGKGRIMDCRLVGDLGALLEIDMTLNGVRYKGTLAQAVTQEEEE